MYPHLANQQHRRDEYDDGDKQTRRRDRWGDSRANVRPGRAPKPRASIAVASRMPLRIAATSSVKSGPPAIRSAARSLTGLVPRWVIPAAVLFLLVGFAPVPGGDFLQIALGLATFGRIAYRILHMSDAEREPGPAAGAPSSPPPPRPPRDRGSTRLALHLRRCQPCLSQVPPIATGAPTYRDQGGPERAPD
ncbi:MAG: hypothetical protein JO132_08155 [Streptosporangiaceae bacterium]|nr:hypothetical protein [Streptosporangiaceae bacterium]